ncbi:tRNA 2-thiouridine synthesizing protein C [Allopseudospirillum japonicum]|uniref:tRNA 2-thiouridine synthesizing protein C n=1 Tax=Allopseudospirillum japonicum TaxID=64971 RepID=A0A1H6Q723_9GAMM|nr:DsrE family protein [Allopseudospirillum japonicum]SEI37676.1 tRNA 2-thiouridine synthesizing protein C [Allopseudospirillum japonicum]
MLLIQRHAPYQGQKAKSLLDIALVAAAFEHQPAMLFLGDGVYQLLTSKKLDTLSGFYPKGVQSTLTALPLYDIDTFYVDAEALNARQLAPDALSLPVTLLEPQQIRQLVRDTSWVITL